MPDNKTYDAFIEAQARALRADDRAPATLAEWTTRRARLRQAMFAAMGPFPEKPTDLTPRIVGTLRRKGYRIEKVLLQTRPDVWMTASAYVPETVKARVPGVLVVHGHWAGARRDPVVQARCLGLVHLGFFVLAVDAFSAGERHPTIQRGSYHGALLGSTLWPTGHTLLGLQVYDNRRAVDYLMSREEVDGKRLGITGASGGGNQSMYAGALDERIGAVVPVCSVGTYQAYLKAACCVCEVLPNALRFTEEGDVLGLVAPRALLVINATKDAFQFSVGEARKSTERASAIFKLHDKTDLLRHTTFESPHDYNKAMREAMYGWMTRWLKDEGKGEPIPEPAHDLEKLEDLACYPDGKRPATFLFPPTFAASEARRLLRWETDAKQHHREAWEARVGQMRPRLLETLGNLPESTPKDKPEIKTGDTKDGTRSASLTLRPETGLEMTVDLRFSVGLNGRLPGCVLLHLDGKDAALKHPLAAELVKAGRAVYAPDLRGTGSTRPASDNLRLAPDHNSAEHALWIGRPLLGQWIADIRAVLSFMAVQPGLNAKQLSVVGLGQAGVVALVAGAVLHSQIASVGAVETPTSYITTSPYPQGTRMGLLVPGILTVGDIPHLAAMLAPRKVVLADGLGSDGQKLQDKPLQEAFAYTRRVFGWFKADKELTIATGLESTKIVAAL